MTTDYKLIKIKYTDEPYVIERHGDWFDLRNIHEEHLSRGDFKYISLGVAIELPKGYEAIIAPRSSTFKNYGIILANSIGIIDEEYNGNDDIWHFPALCISRDVIIPAKTRICQFRIIEHQPEILLSVVSNLENKNRGGLGSTGL